MSNAAARKRSAPPDRQRTGRHRILKEAGDAQAPLILIVDDAADARDMYSEYFLHSGFRVALAVDGDHGLWKVALAKPDLVVMDLSMPVVDGWEAIRQMRSHKKRKT